MSDRTYKSGEKPAVGDVVNAKDFHSTGWNSRVDSVVPDKDYRVKNVSEGSKSTLITVDGRWGEVTMRANRFVLKNSNALSKTKSPPKFFIVSTTGKVSGTATSEEALGVKLSELLLANPTFEYHVFEYYSTAKTKKPEIEFLDRAVEFGGGAGVFGPVGETQGGMFRKTR